jgi:hypothetical protein
VNIETIYRKETEDDSKKITHKQLLDITNNIVDFDSISFVSVILFNSSVQAVVGALIILWMWVDRHHWIRMMTTI